MTDNRMIDTVPVDRAKWMPENTRPKSYLRVCSACRRIAYFCGKGCSYNHRPNCGAKMDAKEG